ncbi:HepT-like ribonuclease domain-containing protein [Compostibacter hankyongensis]|uniref:DUF86 domain-containing protein n=1 Tax=Compostibacter hankyongensis TaxID=1007089 RepID=A0ABP8FW14_9BACT
MKPEAVKYLYDVLDSIHAITHHIKDTPSLKLFMHNPTVTDAVERRLAIIGEALHQIKKKDSSLTGISDHKKIIGLRHILVHDYDLIDHATIWIIVTKHLPRLEEEIQAIIHNLSI